MYGLTVYESFNDLLTSVSIYKKKNPICHVIQKPVSSKGSGQSFLRFLQYPFTFLALLELLALLPSALPFSFNGNIPFTHKRETEMSVSSSHTAQLYCSNPPSSAL